MKKGLTFVILSILFLFTASFAGDMEPASHKQISLIKQGFFEPVTILRTAATIRRDSRYYVGLKFLAKGYETPGIGIWIIQGNKHNPSDAYTVNATASIFSGFVSANEEQLSVSISDPDAKRILNYLKRE